MSEVVGHYGQYGHSEHGSYGQHHIPVFAPEAPRPPEPTASGHTCELKITHEEISSENFILDLTKDIRRNLSVPINWS